MTSFLAKKGRVFLPRNAKWKREFIDELEDFPEAEFDDQVDSTTQALNYFIKGIGGGSRVTSRFNL